MAESWAVPPPIDWETVLQEHASWLRRVVYARLRDHDEAEDVMQDIALAAVSASAAPPADRVAPWLYRVAVRQSLQFRRRRGRQRRRERAAGELSARRNSSETLDPFRWLAAKESREQLRRSLDSLPSRDIELLLLKYGENWRYQQIADHLGMSTAAVESRLFRARRLLRQRLAALQIDEETPG